MTIARCQLVVTDEAGNIVDDAEITVQREAPGLPLAGQCYSNAAGTATLGNPYTAADGADAGFYISGGTYRITATKDAFTREWKDVRVGLAQGVDAFPEVGARLLWDIGTADANPGTGEIRANNASLASATFLYISKTNRAGDDIAAFLAGLDDSTNTAHRGLIELAVEGGAAQAFFVTGAVTDASGYIKLAVSGHSGATAISEGATIALAFNRTGNLGAIGPTGNTGQTGNNFEPDEVVALIAGRAAFDGAAENFAVLVESDSTNSNLPTMYFKLSATSGDWSGGFTFGSGSSGGSTIVDSIADLQALNTVNKFVAVLRHVTRAGVWRWQTGNFSAEVAADTLNGEFAESDGVAATVGVWRRVGAEVLETQWFVDSITGSDSPPVSQSAAVQVALDVLATRGEEVGGMIKNSRGLLFSFASLTLPKRSNILFWRGDENTPNNLTSYVTNEWVMATNNASDGGIVNEHIVIWSAYHPAATLELANHVDSHDAFLGAGQARVPTADNPVRCSWLINHSGWSAWYKSYHMYAGSAAASGVYEYTFNKVVLLNGVDSGDYASPPATGIIPTGATIRGATSGAFGIARTITGTFTQLYWQHGVFQVGEALQVVTGIGTGGEVIVETTTATVTSIAYEQLINPMLTVGTNSGCWSWGAFGDTNQIPWSFAGWLGVQAITLEQNSPYADATRVRFGLADDYKLAAASRSGRHFEWNLNTAAASRRMTLKRDSDNKVLGHVGAVFAHLSMVNGGLVSGFGITSVVRNNTGHYTIAFDRTAVSTGFRVILGKQAKVDNPTWETKTTSGFDIYNFHNDTGTQTDLFATLDITVIGGDI